MYICVNLVRNNHEKISDIWYGLKSFCEERKLTVYVDYTGKGLSYIVPFGSRVNRFPIQTSNKRVDDMSSIKLIIEL